LLEDIVGTGLRTSVRVLSCDTIAAPAAVAQALQIETGSAVQKAVRVRSTRDGPLSHITTWVPHDLARSFGRRERARQPLLLLLEASGVHLGDAAQTISANQYTMPLSRVGAIDAKIRVSKDLPAQFH
jgi:GntR family transcriptional regulator